MWDSNRLHLPNEAEFQKASNNFSHLRKRRMLRGLSARPTGSVTPTFSASGKIFEKEKGSPEWKPFSLLATDIFTALSGRLRVADICRT